MGKMLLCMYKVFITLPLSQQQYFPPLHVNRLLSSIDEDALAVLHLKTVGAECEYVE